MVDAFQDLNTKSRWCTSRKREQLEEAECGASKAGATEAVVGATGSTVMAAATLAAQQPAAHGGNAPKPLEGEPHGRNQSGSLWA